MATLRQVLVGRPWWHSPLLWIAIIAALALSGTLAANFTVWSNPTVPSLPSFQGETNQPVAQPVQSAPQQNVQENVSTTVPVVVKHQVNWVAVQGFDPSTIPVEEGLYNGETPDSVSWDPSNPNSVPAGDAFAWKIFPQLTQIRGSPVAVARATENKNVVLASISLNGNPPPRILLSVNGGRSWCTLNILPVDSNGDDAVAVRVAAYGGEIHLYGQDPRPGYHWWETVVNKSKLPCS